MPDPQFFPSPHDLAPWQWLVLTVAALGSGLGKTGVPGMGVLSVSLFAVALPPRASTGVVLPLLICADVAAVATFRRQHADWSQLWRLFPATAVGVFAGWAAMGALPADRTFARLMGAVLLTLVAVQLWRKRHPRPEDAPHGFGWPTFIGVLAGFTTMTANAAGPLIILYLLGRGLPKLALMGTAAWFFFALNLFKLPFSVQMGLINAGSLPLDLWLIPCAVAGAWSGRWVLPRISPRIFEALALAFTTLAALRLLW